MTMTERIIDHIKALLTQAGPAGHSITELQPMLKKRQGTVRDTVRRYWQKGELFRCGTDKHNRYFMRQEWAESFDWAEHAKAIKAAQEQRKKDRDDKRCTTKKEQRAAARKVQPPKKPRQKPVRIAKVPTPQATPWRQETPTKRNTTHVPRRHVEIINHGVKVQHIPTSIDYRFSVSPHFKGEFSREWQERRA